MPQRKSNPQYVLKFIQLEFYILFWKKNEFILESVLKYRKE